MKLKLFTYLIFSLSFLISDAQQKITLNENGFFINGKIIEKNISQNEVKKILGNPDKKFVGQNIIWIYNDKGIYVYFDPNDGHFKSFAIDFVKQDYKFSPTKTFHDSVLLFGNEINKFSTWLSIKKISQLMFGASPYTVRKAITIKNVIYFDFGSKGEMLEHMSFSHTK